MTWDPPTAPSPRKRYEDAGRYEKVTFKALAGLIAVIGGIFVLTVVVMLTVLMWRVIL